MSDPLDPRINELYEWSEETGRNLPLNPETICDLEDQGLLVDLETGEILEDLGNEGIVPFVEEDPFPVYVHFYT